MFGIGVGHHRDATDEPQQVVEGHVVAGVAGELGAGEDRLVLNEGSQIDGAIEMGEGADTLVNYVAFDRLEFGSEIETVTTTGTGAASGRV